MISQVLLFKKIMHCKFLVFLLIVFFFFFVFLGRLWISVHRKNRRSWQTKSRFYYYYYHLGCSTAACQLSHWDSSFGHCDSWSHSSLWLARHSPGCSCHLPTSQSLIQPASGACHNHSLRSPVPSLFSYSLSQWGPSQPHPPSHPANGGSHSSSHGSLAQQLCSHSFSWTWLSRTLLCQPTMRLLRQAWFNCGFSDPVKQKISIHSHRPDSYAWSSGILDCRRKALQLWFSDRAIWPHLPGPTG